MTAIAFRPLALRDLPTLRGWLNTPHVFRWWGVRSGPGALGGNGADAATDEQVRAKYAPEVGATDARTHRYVIEADGVDIAGIDLFIADATRTGRGLGTQTLDRFVREIVFADPTIGRAVAGPHPGNTASCRAFAKAGFVTRRVVGVPGEGPERIVVRLRSGST
jgi:aminoglycoside 6'-N-acetyltransferase